MRHIQDKAAFVEAAAAYLHRRFFKRRSQESTCAPDINCDHCIASSQERCLELKVDQVDGAAIGEALERPAQPHAPHVSSQDMKLVTNTPITFKVSCTLQPIRLQCSISFNLSAQAHLHAICCISRQSDMPLMRLCVLLDRQ